MRSTKAATAASASAILLLTLCLGACSSTPTSPTNVPVVVNQPPAVVVVTPPVVTPTPSTPVVTLPNPLLSDPRFSLSFYRQMVRNGLEAPNNLEPLRRQAQAPKIYLKTVDEAGNAIDRSSLDQTAAAIERTTGQLTGVFGIAALERGTGSHEGEAGWITVKWMAGATSDRVCGRAPVGGTWIELYPRNNCRCGGGPAVALRVIKHELGHALGFWHTDSRNDLMYIESTTCDQEPSDREKFTAQVAYSQPVGSLDPK